MRRSAAASLGVLFVAALTVSLLLRGDPHDFTPTSYGALPDAYGALHDVLVELGVPVQRSFDPPDRLPPGATVWWVEPHGICGRLSEEGDAEGTRLDLAPWLRAGGTAVLFSAALSACPAPARIAGLALPELGGEGERDPAEPEPGEPAEEERTVSVTGPLVRRPRALPRAPAVFAAVPEPFRTVARADGEAFAVEAPVGEGRLVLVADPFFLRNRWLDRGDGALLALDWVRAYGVPRLDEREHGLRDTPPTLAYLAGSPALPVFAGLAASGVLFAWAGACVPRRRIGEQLPEPPTLATYVESLARLYARAGDHAEVFERYRAFVLAELRRALVLAHDAPAERVQDALRARGLGPAGLAALRGGRRVRGRGDLEAACAALDRLLQGLR